MTGRRSTRIVARLSRHLLVLAVLGALLTGRPSSALAQQAPPSPSQAAPVSRAARGLVYAGLQRDPAGQCQNAFEVGGTGRCTHGPDPAPEGIDVGRTSDPVPLARAKVAEAECDGDGVSGQRTEVLYVRASDRPDRFATYLPSFRTWAADSDHVYQDSAAKTGGSRTIRFVHDAGCTIIVRNAVIPAGTDDDFGSTIEALKDLGYDRVDRKYMLFVDDQTYCGIGTVLRDDQPGAGNVNNEGPSYGRTDAGCWDGHTVAHEHMHNLGGVQLSAPHTSGGYHCVDERDVMCYSDSPDFPVMQYLCPDAADEDLFDCNNDDYFNTNPAPGSYLATRWNVADSQYLFAPPTTPRISVSDASVSEGNSGTSVAAFTVRLARAATSTVTVLASTSDGTATAPSDFTARSSTITFPAGTTTQPFGVTVSGDTAIEANETFAVALTDPVGAPIADGQGVGTIVNDDVPPPPNDSFGSPVALTGSGGVVTGSNAAASKQPGEPAHAGNAGGASIWYSWTAPHGGTVTFNTFASAFDTLLAVYTGTAVDSLTVIAANDDSGESLQSQVTFTPVAGAVYRIAVDGFGGNTGATTLRWSQPPPNDSFGSPVALSAAGGRATGTNVSATREPGEPTHGGNAGGASVWYSWTAPASGTVRFDTFGSDFDTLLGVYTGSTVDGLTLIAANDDSSGLLSAVGFAAASGTVYRIAVDGYSGASGPIVLNWGAPPPNDSFASAVALSAAGGRVTGTNAVASKEPGEPIHGGNSGGTSVWYSWTAPAGGTVSFDTIGSGFDTLLGVYTGSAVDGLTEIAGNDDGDGLQSRVSFAAVSGTEYRIAVDGFRRATGPIVLNVATAGTAPAFTAASPPTAATKGTAYGPYTFTASGSPPPTFALASGTLPAGVDLSPTGVLSGTPTATGAFTFAVRATNGISPDAVSTSVTITVLASIVGSAFVPLTPARVWDSRFGPGPVGAVGPGQTRTITVTGANGVPASGVTAVVLNVTAVAPTAATFVTAWPAGEPRPLASNLNVPPGDVRPNLVIVKVSAAGQVSLSNDAGSVNLIADVAGYYGATGSGFTSLTPARVWDSRFGPGPVGAVGPGQTRTITVTGANGVPASGVTAVVLNVTAVAPTAATFVTAWPAGEPRPLASNLNVPPGDVRPNLVIVKVSAAGQVSLSNDAGSVNLIADVAGYYGAT